MEHDRQNCVMQSEYGEPAMRYIALLVAAALPLFATTTAMAQRLPDGTWRATCRDPYVRGGIVGAVCRTADGRWRETRIDPRQCHNGRLENDDGRLQCERGGGGWQGGDRRWTYLATCRDIRQDGPMIRARCQDHNGNWRNSGIDARQCREDVANIDGRLTCADWNRGGRRR
jgi:hypothetical protein